MKEKGCETAGTVSFELLEHPADLGFRAYGNSLEELFARCGQALLSIILDPSDIRREQQWELRAEGDDIESLLVNWLNEVLYYVDTKRAAFNVFSVSFPTRVQLTCTAWGELRDAFRHPVRLSVKAVTYHQLKVLQKEEVWVAEVYVDV